MICPSCGTHIPDGSAVCPACHARLDSRATGDDAEPIYCKNCGALVSPDDEYCPKCGMPLPKRASAPSRSAILSERLADPAVTGSHEPLKQEDEGDDDDLSSTHVIPRIESALPPDPASEEAEEDSESLSKHSRSIVIIAILALVVVGGITLVITHPWDPDAYSIKATTAADTSKAGFPGTISELKGQDKSATEDSSTAISGDEATYEQLHADWEALGEYADQLDEAENDFEDVAFSGTAEERQAAADDVESISISISNTIDDISSADVSSGTYSDTQVNLMKLGNWLRNRADNLTDAWNAALSYDDPASKKDTIMSILEDQQDDDGTNTYAAMFEENYSDFEPAEPA